MRIERQIDAGRAECRIAYATASENKRDIPNHLHNNHAATDSSGFEDSDSDLDLGGPEANATLPDNDQTITDVEADDESQDVSLHSRESTRKFRRASSAAASTAASPDSIRKRRRQIISSLGLTSDQPTLRATPPAMQKGDFNFDLSQDGGGGSNSDYATSEGFGVSTGRAPSEREFRRKLSTGQLWLGKTNRRNGPAANAFGSGLSDEDGLSGDEIDSERSYEKS